MTLLAHSISHIDNLKSLIEENNLQKSELCLVGSAAFAVREIRVNSDLDICFSDTVVNLSDLNFPSELEKAPNKYVHLGLSDDDLLTNSRYHDIVDDYKIVRPEIEYVHKKRRGWEKDKKDIELLEQYRKKTDDWDHELEAELYDYTPGASHLLWRGIHSVTSNGVRETVGHGIQYLCWHGPLPRRSSYSGQPTTIPGKALRSLQQEGIRTTLSRGIRLLKLKEPTGLLDRYSRLRHKAKLGTLVERELELRYPTGRLLTNQYDGCQFTRLDIVVRLLAAEALLENEPVPTVVEIFETHSGLAVRKDLQTYVDQYDVSGIPPTVPVGYDSTILDANALAVALLADPESVPVTVTAGSSTATYDRSWFENVGFTVEERETVEEAFSELLYRSNTLFAAILWPPAQQHVDHIIEQIRSEKKVHVIEELQLSDETFPDFVWALYESQADLNPNHIDAKIEQMDGYDKTVSVIGVEVPDPRIRDGFSNEILQMKERVRENFTPKILTDNPSANLIIHATDNYAHSKETWEIIEAYSSEPLIQQRE